MSKRIILLSVFSIAFGLHLIAQATWTQKADLPAPGRVHAVAFSIGTKGYIGTGMNTGGALATSDFWKWDQATNIWTQVANFANGTEVRIAAVGFAIGNKGYVGTGIRGTSNKDMWEYDPSGNSWTKKADFGGVGRGFATGFSIGSKGYLGTGEVYGSAPFSFYSDFWEFDPSNGPNGSWTQQASYPGGARVSAVGFSIGNKGYVGTGYIVGPMSDEAKKDFYEFDPATNIWTQKKDFGGSERYLAVGFSICNKGYIGTGADKNGTPLKDFWEYDPTTDTWTQRPDYGGEPIRDAVGFGIGDKGYIATGSPFYDKTSPSKSLWEYGVDIQTTTCGLTALVSSDPNSVCPGGTVGIIASGGDTYFWNTGATTDFIQDTPTSTTTYSVTVKNNAGCEGVTSITVQVLDCGGVGTADIHSSAGKFFVFPNPFSSTATINVGPDSYSEKNCSVNIIDMTGKIVRSFSNVKQFPYEIDRGDLAVGMYMIELRSENNPDGYRNERIKLMVE